MFSAALRAVAPEHCLPPALPDPPKRGRTLVVGAGKAAASMARAVERHWVGPYDGLVVTRYGHAMPDADDVPGHIEVIEAAHPVPDGASRWAAERIMAQAEGLTAKDLLLCLWSGGGSSLLTLPAPGLSLQDKRQLTVALLRSGASISEINIVRKHLSAIKGGRLAVAAYPAPVVSLIISDVPGDDPGLIASGPTEADASTYEEACAIVARYRIDASAAALLHLAAACGETPKPGDPRLELSRSVIIATPQMALEAAAEVARQAGITPIILGSAIEGEAREVAVMHAGIINQMARYGQPGSAPAVLLSGGETTVTVRGRSGRGGRNSEFLLALALAIGAPNPYRARIHAMACDTDGIDGTEDNAGALLYPDTLERAAALGLDGRSALMNNDAYSFFAGLNDLVVTGPTRTNVNDFRAILLS